MTPASPHPLVSVIIPCYNCGQVLPRALDSVLGQTLRDIELICVDDGSTDDTAAVLARYAAQAPRVRVITQANSGSGPARNSGMAAATGAYIAFMDSDDAYPAPDVLETLYATAEKHGVDIAGGSLQILHANGSITPPSGSSMDGSVFTSEGVMDYADYQYDFGYYRFIFKRSLIEAHGIRFPAVRRYQDPPFFVRAMHAAGRFAHIAAPTYLFTGNPGTHEWKSDRAAREMLVGVADVLDFSRGHGYTKLHSYTLKHMMSLLIVIIDTKKDAAKIQGAVRDTLLHADSAWAEAQSPAVGALRRFKRFVRHRRFYRLGIRLCAAFLPTKEAKRRMRNIAMDPALWL